ncbi:MAG: DEAD/DEAH box helicase [Desulfobacteraceae bacterium]|nr:DEAD/DEAH box helicase [Desulfobacteraceae bacterium]
MSFAVGSLVKARDREWVVLPDSDEELLLLRPLGGREEEITGVYLPLENVEPATFDLPDPMDPGDHRSCKLLRDAVRLGFRASSGPFRCFGHIAVEPRPYQIVPLLLALKLDPVRLLIGDDVGIGKTVEALLVARELLDRGEISRICVLCPPHLTDQWQAELYSKFHIQAATVIPGTVKKLEKELRVGQSLFEVYPYTVVSLDYIKSDRRRSEFQRTCPELVIVDEAHTCAHPHGTRGRQQRDELVNQISRDPDRHLVLVTATPHSGKEDTFRSLLSFLNPEFINLPEDLSGKNNERQRRKLAQHFIQRRRGDVKTFMQKTPFPDRESLEEYYSLTKEYKKLFERAVSYAKESVEEPSSDRGRYFRQRVRWWSALALLRSLASSPQAAAATLRNRAANMDAQTAEEVNEVGRRTVLDLMDQDIADSPDTIPGSDIWAEETGAEKHKRTLQQMARAAERLAQSPEKYDNKLVGALELVRKLLRDGYSPIVFCRFIPTAEYVANYFRQKLKQAETGLITGQLPSAERESRVHELGNYGSRVLVCTDCLSEGINIQKYFNAAVHYDLSWNPTRHEQREGRVDRFAQPESKVRVVTYYGVDNQIDGIVLDVLLRKHKAIRKSLGIAVPVPEDSEKVLEAIFEGLLLKGKHKDPHQLLLPGMEEFIAPEREKLFGDWDKAVQREEKRSRTLFAQASIKPEQVGQEIQSAREAVGTSKDVRSFTLEVLKLSGAGIHTQNPGAPPESQSFALDLSALPKGLKDRLGLQSESFQARFELPAGGNQHYLSRTHPFVENLAGYVLDTTLDPYEKSLAKRCGAIRTGAVNIRTTLLLLRLRYHLNTKVRGIEKPLLAEECQVMAYEGPPGNPTWLPKEKAVELMDASPGGNIYPEQATRFIQKVIDNYDVLEPVLEQTARDRAEALLEAHRRVRTASGAKGLRYDIKPNLPVDILGIYVLLPV